MKPRGESSSQAILPARSALPAAPRMGAIERSAPSDDAPAEVAWFYAGLLDARTRVSYEPPSVVADWLDLGAFGRAVDFRARRAGFFGRPRPILTASSRRCWV